MKITIEAIIKAVCEYFNMPIDHIQIKSRKREIVQPRQIAMYFSREMTKKSLAEIGSGIGNKDHATALNSCKVVNNLIDTDKEFRFNIDEIEKLILLNFAKAEKANSVKKHNANKTSLSDEQKIKLYKRTIDAQNKKLRKTIIINKNRNKLITIKKRKL